MLTRLIVHHWYTLASYTLAPGRVTLVDAATDFDPTDPIDLLEILRDFVLQGRSARKMFPRRSLPAGRFFDQDFTLELHGPEGRFKYELLIEQDRRRDDGCRSGLETLWHDDSCVAMYHRGHATPADPHDADGQPAHVDPALSVLHQLDADADPRIAAFKRLLARIHVVHTLPDPPDSDDDLQAACVALDDARKLLHDPALTVAVVVPDRVPAPALEPFLHEAHAAQTTGRGAQLLLSSPRPILLRRFVDLAREPASSTTSSRG